MREKIIYQALSQKVLAVIVINYKSDDTIFDWTAYIDAVEGHNHENEFQQVARMGTKLSRNIASALFSSYPVDKFRY